MMKLEYLPDGSDDCPLVRLYGYDPSDIVALQQACIALADGRLREVLLDNQPWVSVIGGCRFILRAGPVDRGMRPREGDEPFVMEYASEGWRETADKLAPLVGGSDGFQWLTDGVDVNVLISRSGEW